MKKKIVLIVISFLLAIIFITIVMEFHPLPQIDSEQPREIYRNIEIFDFHSYVRKPPLLRRATADYLEVFEIAKGNLGELLNNIREKEIIIDKEEYLPPILIKDVVLKIKYIKKYLSFKGKRYEYPVSGELRLLFRENYDQLNKKYRYPDPLLDNFIIVGDSVNDKNRYVVIFTHSENYTFKMRLHRKSKFSITPSK